MKVLIAGASGQAGRALLASAPTGIEMTSPARDTLDIADADAVRRAVAAATPDVIVNAAAYTDVEAAEKETEQAIRINAEAPRTLAVAAKEHGARLLHVSTDYVFAGDRPRAYRPDDETRPINGYGASKLAGEHAVLETLAERGCIVRTSWLYFAGGNNFVHTMLELMQDRGSVRVVSDQIGAPTWAHSLALAIWKAIEHDLHGVHHWRDDGVASWYDFARAIADIAVSLGLLQRAVEVIPVTSAEFPTAAKRPPFSLLDIEATANRLGMRPGHWRDNLRSMLEQLAR